jgi:hypothetical protein
MNTSFGGPLHCTSQQTHGKVVMVINPYRNLGEFEKSRDFSPF